MGLLLFCTAVGANDLPVSQTAAPSTLDDYLHLALAQNAGLQSRFAEYKAAMAEIPQAGALDDPTFSYGYWLEQMETQEKQRFGLMQMLPWFGTLEARTDAAAAMARAAAKRFDAARLNVAAQTKSAYYEFAYLGRAMEIARQNFELLKHFEQVSQARYRTAGQTHPDIIRAQIELAIFEDELITLERKKQPTTALVNAILNRAPSLELPWPQQEPMPAEAIDTAQVVAAIQNYNPQLAAFSHEIAAARSRVELAQKRSKPNLTVGFEWMQMDKATMPDGHRRDAYLATVAVNLPLWTSSYNAGVQQARLMGVKTAQEKIQAESDLAAQAAELMFAVEDSARKVRLYQAALIPKAKEMLAVSEQTYRSGGIDFLSLIDAQRKLLDFELQYERMRADHLTQRAALEELVGGTLPIQKEQADDISK